MTEQIGRRRAAVAIAPTTVAILDHITADAAIFGIDRRYALFAPRLVELLLHGRIVRVAMMVHAERDVLDDLQSTWTQLSFTSRARAIARDALLFAEQLGRQVRCEISAVFRFANASAPNFNTLKPLISLDTSTRSI